MRRISSLESLLLLILCGFALAFLFETTTLQQTAALFPRLVSEASLFIFVIALVFKADHLTEKMPHKGTSFGGALALQAGYLVVVFVLGFPIATFLYLLACPRLMGYRRWKILIPYGVLLTSAVFLIFGYALHVRFPTGLLWR
jgi:Tripartite tricarboxylate transporter TctB family